MAHRSPQEARGEQGNKAIALGAKSILNMRFCMGLNMQFVKSLLINKCRKWYK